MCFRHVINTFRRIVGCGLVIYHKRGITSHGFVILHKTTISWTFIR